MGDRVGDRKQIKEIKIVVGFIFENNFLCSKKQTAIKIQRFEKLQSPDQEKIPQSMEQPPISHGEHICLTPTLRLLNVH